MKPSMYRTLMIHHIRETVKNRGDLSASSNLPIAKQLQELKLPLSPRIEEYELEELSIEQLEPIFKKTCSIPNLERL